MTSPRHVSLPLTPVLHGNYPNPFNPSTTISFTLPATSWITLEVVDILGRRVRLLQAGPAVAGVHTIVWDARDDQGGVVAGGVYLCRLVSGTSSLTRTMLLLK